MALNHKALVLILDGIGDRSCRQLSGRTPLEAARTPAMDSLAENGLCGMVDPLFPGVPVDTHTGVGALFGIPPRYLVGLSRGPVEAAGIGIEVEPGDILMRCNFATVAGNHPGQRILDRRAGRIREGTSELAEALLDVDLGRGVRASLLPATQHRGVLMLRGEGLSAAVTDTDPRSRFQDTGVLECRAVKPDDTLGRRTAEAVNRFIGIAHRHLDGHPLNASRVRAGHPPANGILTRGAGVAKSMESVLGNLALRVAVTTGELTVAGLARLLGFRLLTNQAFTALPDTDLTRKLAVSLDALSKHDLVFLHVKAPDICSHDQDPDAKRRFFERLDDELTPLLGLNQVIGITGDHSTCSLLGRHTGDPVPSLICTPDGRCDGQTRFGERSCMTGGLGRVTATGYLHTLLDSMGALTKFHPGDERFFF
jgi:2,3-bisphosphoglycerate-independent phosphoglycerate mutase